MLIDGDGPSWGRDHDLAPAPPPGSSSQPRGNMREAVTIPERLVADRRRVPGADGCPTQATQGLVGW
ncbi:hypothetical protein DMH12_04770 [Streptomyces sp. WAC 04229]|uniref:hypothetical protein n=1 Tax=Streptomyces sp. WAC 04229 TaxID=2203206 RepID=UPI000F747B04|nr:hypothetical protein [Streptomyces sp. WAC 04229]RSN63825.1 hypothetical protein DMH12_04770 [Streptomyces sp. WAC 04229]